MTGIYAIRRRADGTCYVGSSAKVELRWKQHLGLLLKHRHHAPYLQHSWDKYGPAAHEFVVLEICARDKATLLSREQHYLDALPSTFNVSRVAGSRLGVPQPRASVEKVAAGNRGRKHSAETCAKKSAALKGRPNLLARLPKSQETRDKMSVSKKGWRPTDEQRLNYGRHWIGRKHSEESRAKMSVSRIGKTLSSETRIKIGAAHLGNSWGLGHKKTPEQIEKTRRFHVGRKRSAETCERMRVAWVQRRANSEIQRSV